MKKQEKIEKTQSKAAKTLMVTAGVTLGVALSFFVVIGRGVKKVVEGLRDDK